MGHNEKDWIENYNGSTILFYRRYVDDTFRVFDRQQDAVSFLLQLRQFATPEYTV